VSLELIVSLIGFTLQIACLAYIARTLQTMRNEISPGEAAIYREMKQLVRDLGGKG